MTPYPICIKKLQKYNCNIPKIIWQCLDAGTVPASKKLNAGTVPAYKKLDAGTLVNFPKTCSLGVTHGEYPQVR